jgi:hypothetical protein
MSDDTPNGHDEADVASSDLAGDALDAALESAQLQMRGVLEEAAKTAREQVRGAAAELAERETEIAAREAAVLADRVEVDRKREEVVAHLAAAASREAAAEAQLEEAELRNAEAAQALADATERTSMMIEEAERRIREDEARSQEKIKLETDEARNAAGLLHIQAASRLEAVSAESTALLKGATERANAIVNEAETDAERAKLELREIIGHIEDFLESVPASAKRFEFDPDPAIDLRSEPQPEAVATADPADEVSAAEEPPEDVVEPIEDADDTADAEDDEVVEAVEVVEAIEDIEAVEAEEPVAEDPVTDEWQALMPDAESEPVAGEVAMEAYFDKDEATPAEEDEEPRKAVADAVRRAVKDWSASRQPTQ